VNERNVSAAIVALSTLLAGLSAAATVFVGWLVWGATVKYGSPFIMGVLLSCLFMVCINETFQRLAMMLRVVAEFVKTRKGDGHG
jgi:hypothetical protein